MFTIQRCSVRFRFRKKVNYNWEMYHNLLIAFVAALVFQVKYIEYSNFKNFKWIWIFQSYVFSITTAQDTSPTAPKICNLPNCKVLHCKYGQYTPAPAAANECPGCPLCRPEPCRTLPCAFRNCSGGTVTPVDQYGCSLCPECVPTTS